MDVGRWTLLISMVLVAPLLWWSGVASAAYVANGALGPGDSTLPYAVANYRSGGLSMTAVFAVLNLLLITVVLPTDRRLREGRTGTHVRAVVAALLVTGVAWCEYRFNPMTYNWSGDPDAWDAVEGHVRPWHPVAGALWIVLNAAAAASLAVRARARTPSAG